MSSSRVNPEIISIPLSEIRLATQDFSPEKVIGKGGFGTVYKGQLSENWQNRTAAFRRFNVKAKQEPRYEVDMMSNFNHDNIISLIGYCDEDDEMIAVFEYASNGSLDDHLHDVNKMRFLTWAQRLTICIGVATGLEYLHSGLGDNKRVYHGDMQSANILLNDKLEAKISNFGLSLLVDAQVHKDAADTNSYLNHFNKQNDISMYTKEAGTKFYIDPIYQESGVLNRESDVYSYGIILFEMLSGMLAYIERVIGDDPQPQRLINLVRRYSDDDVGKLVDLSIKDHINIRSLLMFKEIAYHCISWNLKDRPAMNTVINRLQEALVIQKQGEASTGTIRSYSYQPQNLDILRIPLQEIIFATKNFGHEATIGDGGFGRVYKGQWHNRIVAIKRLDRDSYQGEREFRNELELISSSHHQNIIPLVGYCDEANEMILVYDYASNGSLDHLLRDPNKRCRIPWTHRLKICLGAARGLEFLHSGLGVDMRVIHRDVKTANILLDDNLEAKLSDFGLSVLVDKNQPQVYHPIAGTSYYIDPVYRESGTVNTELDVYSFGVVLLEMLTGTLAYNTRGIHGDQRQKLTNLVRRYYHDDGLDMLIDPIIRDEIDSHSFHVFLKIAYRCISYNLKDRPTMKRIVKKIEEALEIQTRANEAQGEASVQTRANEAQGEVSVQTRENEAQGAASTILTRSRQHQEKESFRISLDDIKYTEDKEHRIGDGGFGKVYKGQLAEGLPKGIVAIKCLDPKGHQGKTEFLNEVELICSFHHPNIIPFVGYCDERDQMIMLSEYAENGSLDHHLHVPTKKKNLTWSQRLKICLGAAKGLDYLHSGPGKGRVIHRDVKSGNILLDKNFEAKLCDFGLSKKGPINQHTQIYTKAAGTMFYLDPAYHESGILSKESDVYSFGVVLFEMLSGALAYNPTTFVDGISQYLIILVRRYCVNEPKKLIDPDIRDEVDSQCFETFKEIAYQCINLKLEERPTMDTIIDRLEDAIEFQELKVKRDEKDL